jgi:hypothetical protein
MGTMQLTDTQARVLQLAANAELRTAEQMLSLLLAEGFRFYFLNRQEASDSVEVDTDEIVRQLMTEAAAMPHQHGGLS